MLYWLFDKVRWYPFSALCQKSAGVGFAIILAVCDISGLGQFQLLNGQRDYFFDQLMERTPGVKFIYSSTKDFFEAFAGDKKV